MVKLDVTAFEGGILLIKVNDVRDMNHVKAILDNISSYVKAYEVQIGELSEDALENMTFQICEIEEFIIGMQKINSSNLADADLRMMIYWKYIDGKCSFLDMIEELKKYEGEV